MHSLVALQKWPTPHQHIDKNIKSQQSGHMVSSAHEISLGTLCAWKLGKIERKPGTRSHTMWKHQKFMVRGRIGAFHCEVCWHRETNRRQEEFPQTNKPNNCTLISSTPILRSVAKLWMPWVLFMDVSSSVGRSFFHENHHFFSCFWNNQDWWFFLFCFLILKEENK